MTISPDLSEFVKKLFFNFVHFCSFLFSFFLFCSFLFVFVQSWSILFSFVHFPKNLKGFPQIIGKFLRSFWICPLNWLHYLEFHQIFLKFLSIFGYFFATNIFEKGQIYFFRMVCDFSYVLLDLTKFLFMSSESFEVFLSFCAFFHFSLFSSFFCSFSPFLASVLNFSVFFSIAFLSWET